MYLKYCILNSRISKVKVTMALGAHPLISLIAYLMLAGVLRKFPISRTAEVISLVSVFNQCTEQGLALRTAVAVLLLASRYHHGPGISAFGVIFLRHYKAHRASVLAGEGNNSDIEYQCFWAASQNASREFSLQLSGAPVCTPWGQCQRMLPPRVRARAGVNGGSVFTQTAGQANACERTWCAADEDKTELGLDGMTDTIAQSMFDASEEILNSGDVCRTAKILSQVKGIGDYFSAWSARAVSSALRISARDSSTEASLVESLQGIFHSDHAESSRILNMSTSVKAASNALGLSASQVLDEIGIEVSKVAARDDTPDDWGEGSRDIKVKIEQCKASNGAGAQEEAGAVALMCCQAIQACSLFVPTADKVEVLCKPSKKKSKRMPGGELKPTQKMQSEPPGAKLARIMEDYPAICSWFGTIGYHEGQAAVEQGELRLRSGFADFFLEGEVIPTSDAVLLVQNCKGNTIARGEIEGSGTTPLKFKVSNGEWTRWLARDPSHGLVKHRLQSIKGKGPIIHTNELYSTGDVIDYKEPLERRWYRAQVMR